MGCQCGGQTQGTSAGLACLECGCACCPSCAVTLESASYCRSCAGQLLGTAVETSDPFELSG